MLNSLIKISKSAQNYCRHCVTLMQ